MPFHVTKLYVVFDENKKPDLRKGKIIQNAQGLYYFLRDWNKAKRFDGIPLYRKSEGKGEFLRFVCYRTKKHINTV